MSENPQQQINDSEEKNPQRFSSFISSLFLIVIMIIMGFLIGNFIIFNDFLHEKNNVHIMLWISAELGMHVVLMIIAVGVLIFTIILKNKKSKTFNYIQSAIVCFVFFGSIAFIVGQGHMMAYENMTGMIGILNGIFLFLFVGRVVLIGSLCLTATCIGLVSAAL